MKHSVKLEEFIAGLSEADKAIAEDLGFSLRCDIPTSGFAFFEAGFEFGVGLGRSDAVCYTKNGERYCFFTGGEDEVIQDITETIKGWVL